jgi:nitrile hydratase beta subunit
MGGLHGFGTVVVEADEPVFHERWEARLFGMIQSLGGNNIDAGRHSIERLDPVSYLRNGYYGRWLGAFERGIVEAGVVTEDEIRQRVVSPRAIASSPRSSTWRPARRSYARKVDAAPAFVVGQRVVTRNHQPSGHTRLPAYARSRRGEIASVHAAMVFPDDHAAGRGENPQYLYTVRFTATELWGDAAEANTVFHIDLFESYFEAAS